MGYLPDQLVKDVVHQHRPQTPKQLQAIVQYISFFGFYIFSVFPPPFCRGCVHNRLPFYQPCKGQDKACLGGEKT